MTANSEMLRAPPRADPRHRELSIDIALELEDYLTELEVDHDLAR